MNNKTNAITAKIVEYRYIGKSQLNADDMGGVGCANWEQYLTVCNFLAKSAWNHTVGRATDDNAIDAAIAGLLDFFGISVVDSKKYTARILSVMVDRKAQRSQTLKDALKDKREAKKEWEDAIADELSDEEIADKKSAYEEACKEVDKLYLEPKNYWFDPTPVFDTRTGKAKPAARKALEDTCADIFSERQFMSADELQAERIALEDERKGRKARKKAEAKAKAEANA